MNLKSIFFFFRDESEVSGHAAFWKMSSCSAEACQREPSGPAKISHTHIGHNKVPIWFLQPEGNASHRIPTFCIIYLLLMNISLGE